MLNTLADYPKETKDGKVFIKVAGAAYNLPREKPAPVPKPLTKWERFAKEKGIQKKKKPRTTWDDTLQVRCHELCLLILLSDILNSILCITEMGTHVWVS